MHRAEQIAYAPGMRRLVVACCMSALSLACTPPRSGPSGATGDAAPGDAGHASPVMVVPVANVRPPLALGSIASQDEVRTDWLRERLETVLPGLMREHGVDAWIVLAREYNEGPEFFSLVAPQTLAARRTTILAFFDRGEGGGIERLALGGGSQAGLYTVYRDPDIENRELYGTAQWALLRKLLDERSPKAIAIHTSRDHAFADGLSHGLHRRLVEALGPHAERLRPAEHLAIDYIYQRTQSMRPRYRELMEVAHEIIAYAFSSAVITPGVTTTDEVVLEMREQARARGLGEWFVPTVDLQRKGRVAGSPLDEGVRPVIERGDVLHCDFGLVGLGLATDTQHLAYVLREGEAAPPEGLTRALKRTNDLQDLLMAEMKPGRTGNEVLAAALEGMREAGIDGSIYTHPIGDHGHGAGPLIGLWDRQEAIPARGEVKLRPETWYAIELQATTPVPEWDNQPVRAALEEDAVLQADGTMAWVLRRQETFHLVR